MLRRRARARGRTRAGIAAGMVMALALASAVYAATAARPADDQGAVANSAPAPASVPAPVNIPDSAYPYPANAIFAAPGGNDAGAGTIGDPYATVAHAVAAAASGATIVLRGGVYREALGTITKPITLQSYPHEQAWLSGSVVVSGWTPAPGGNAWAHTGWTTQFCQTCFDPNAIVAAYPNAGLPDMVFINGRALAQVTSLAAVGPGTFFVDYNAQTLYVGDDPTAAGTTVEAAAQSQAAMFNPGAAGSVVRGVGFEEYASTYNPWPNPAMVVDNAAPNIDFERDAFARSASRGLTVYATGVSVTDSVFVDNGMVGLHANAADHLDVERNLVARNDNEHFVATNSSITSTAGIKITSTGWATIKNNVVEDNYANGIWCDLSCHDLQIVDNLSRRNNQNGIFVEVSGLALVASNVSVQNGLDGVRLSGTTDTRAYNNTLADNGAHAIGVFDDGRRNTDPATLALGITWQPARNTIYNNLLATSASTVTGPLLLTQDNDRPMVDDAASMVTGLDDNVYARANSSAPAALALWIHGSKKAAATFATLGALQAGTGDESSGLELTGPGAAPLFNDLASGDYSLAPGSPAAGSGAPLPIDIASAVGTGASGAVDRGALLGPASAPSTTTTTATAPSAQLPALATVSVVVTNAYPVALAPSGAVTLVDTTTGTTIGSASLDGTGTATFNTAAFNPGSHDLTVQYGGDRDNDASGGGATLDVSAAVSATSISADAAQAVFGQTVTFTAHVDASVVPTGTVTFSDTGQAIGALPVDANGDAVFTDDALALGSHTVSASYGGDAQTAPSSDTDDADVTVAVASTAPSLVASPAVPEIGEAVTLHAVVGAVAPGAGVPTGSVSFYDGNTLVADVALDGSGAADAQIAALSAGTHSLTVAYAGDDNFAGATSDPLSLTAVARRATTTLGASAPTAVFGQSVTLTAQVNDDAGAVTDGAVTFTDTTTSQVLGVAALDANGNASVSTSALDLGDHAITASFGGNAEGDSASTASATVSVAQAAVTIAAQVTPASVTAGGSVHVHASVAAAAPGAGTPSGVVHVDDTTTGAHLADLALDAGGAVDGDVSASTPGAHTLTLTYSGDDDFSGGATTAGYGVVAAATTTITSVDMANPSFGQTVTLQAVVTGGARTPTGTVQFSDGANVVGTASLDGTGTATLTTSALATGPHSIVASYGGDANSTASDSSATPLLVEVGPAPTETSVAANVTAPAHGQLVTFTIAVTGESPSGTVTLLDGTTPITPAL
ncbi:MAG TPA: Ig-like domain repeat protein, partial [Acidimicrobiia bacterium]